MVFSPSLFEAKTLFGLTFYVKRDDLLDQNFSGNKARKFYYFLQRDFPRIKRLVSFGSNQSNAMYSLSVLAKLKEWEFIYVCDHVPSFLKAHPIGNYAKALQNGMRLIESHSKEQVLAQFKDDETLHVEEGGRQKESEEGLCLLAQELIKDVESKNLKNPYLFLPSGTGTTALYLQKHLPFRVYTCATVGDDAYLHSQWRKIEPTLSLYPTILESEKKYHYGKLYPELYALWQTLKNQTGVEFDLVYDPIGWKVLLDYLSDLQGTLIYLHQGGLQGNSSMLERYARKLNML